MMIKQEIINEIREYIRYKYINTSVSECRRYNIALNKIIETEKLGKFNDKILKLNNKILEYINNNEIKFEYLDAFIKQIPIFYKYFDEYEIDFTEDMKFMQCIIVFYMYAFGEEIKIKTVDNLKRCKMNDEIEKQYNIAINAIIDLREVKNRAVDKYDKIVSILKTKKPKEVIKAKRISGIVFPTTESYKIYDYSNGVDMAIIIGEILGKSREEVLNDIGLVCF